MHVLRHIDRTRYQFDFLTHTTDPCFYDDEIRSLGCRIIPCTKPHRPWQYARKFRRILKDYGPYDIIHSHSHNFSGIVLRLATKQGISVRIAHSHNDTPPSDVNATLFRGGYLRLTEWMIARYATHGLACSEKAAQSLFGVNWRNDLRWRIMHCGIDLAPFEAAVDRSAIRAELSIPNNTFVIGHVGRFAGQKNHSFLVDIFAEAVRRDPRVLLLLIGDGPLRKTIEAKAKRMGLAAQVRFLGVRQDVARLMRGAMDVFVLPSTYEGLGLVLIEAQASGLACVVSDVVPCEATVVPDLVTRLSLDETTHTWSNTIRKAQSTPSHRAVAMVKESSFAIDKSLLRLREVYCRLPS